MTRPMPNEDFAEMAAGMRRMQASAEQLVRENAELRARDSAVHYVEDEVTYCGSRTTRAQSTTDRKDVTCSACIIADVHLRAFEEAKTFVASFLGYKMTEDERHETPILNFVVGLANEIKRLRIRAEKAEAVCATTLPKVAAFLEAWNKDIGTDGTVAAIDAAVDALGEKE